MEEEDHPEPPKHPASIGWSVSYTAVGLNEPLVVGHLPLAWWESKVFLSNGPNVERSLGVHLKFKQMTRLGGVVDWIRAE